MTSRNSLHSKKGFFYTQIKMTGRRLWIAGLTILYLFMYYIVGTVMIIARSNRAAAMNQLSADAAIRELFTEVSKWLGFRGEFLFIAVIIAAVIAIQGFSYLFDMQKLDFYESQPVSRRKRFFDIYVNGFLMFVIPLLLCVLAATGLSAAMGVMNVSLMVEAWYQCLRTILVFFSAYSIAIFAVMLSGRGIIAALFCAFIYLFDTFSYYLLDGYMGLFFKTYFAWDSPEFMLSPFYNSLAIFRSIDGRSFLYYYAPMSKILFEKMFRMYSPGDLINLIVGAVFLAAAYVLYQKRRSESAGMSLVGRPARFVVRVFSSVYIGLGAAYLTHSVLGAQTASEDMTYMVAATVFAAIVASGIINSIYEFDIRKFFGKYGETLIAVVVSVVAIIVFRYDLLGYDRYIPRSSRVESASLYSMDNGYYYGDADDIQLGTHDWTYLMDNMKITNIDDLLSVVRISQPNLAKANDESRGWNCVVNYRMKNGRTVSRQILIPYDIDPALMDAVVTAKSYREGLFPVYSDDNMKAVSQYMEILYSNGVCSKKLDGEKYEEFSEAYKKDLEKYSFTLVTTEDPIGTVTVQGSMPNAYITENYAVYDCYSNTVAFLKKNGIYLESIRQNPEQITGISVYRYNEEGEDISAEYHDADTIRQIVDSSYISGFTNEWIRYDLLENRYDVNVLNDMSALEKGTYYSYCYMMLYKDSIPQFIIDDVGEPGSEISDKGIITYEATDMAR